MPSLTIRGIRKSYGEQPILKGIDLELEKGEFLVLLGPSGCGKSTLLNMIAGLESLTEGQILIEGRVVNDVHPKDRDIAMVFQSYALYPNMSVRRNIAFPLKMRGIGPAEQEAAVQRVSQLLQLDHLLDRKPAQLSGGQRQRVAMGRALVRDPQVFLFDEPLSNLDAKLRVDMRTEIKKLHDRLGTTIVYVTHDQIEAMTLATRVAVMKDGAVQQCGDPQTVYEKPANLFVAGFMGSPAMNFIPGRVVRNGDGLAVRVQRRPGQEQEAVDFPLAGVDAQVSGFEGREVVLGVRPEAITKASASGGSDRSAAEFEFDGDVVVVEPTGADKFAVLGLGGIDVIAKLRPRDDAAKHQRMRFAVDMSTASVFDPAGGMRL
jgi:multiple sugar transport system ATP-binding protein